MYSPPIIINTFEEAITLYRQNLPWEEDVVRARVVLAVLEYLWLTRPTINQLATAGLTYERISDELNRVRGFLNVGDVTSRSFLQKVSSKGIV